MPVRVDGFNMFDSEVVSTWPQNIAYKAAQLCNPELASKFLRRMREASAAEARQIGRREVLIELASEVGVDLAAFMGHLDDGSAEGVPRRPHDDPTLWRRRELASARNMPRFSAVAISPWRAASASLSPNRLESRQQSGVFPALPPPPWRA